MTFPKTVPPDLSMRHDATIHLGYQRDAFALLQRTKLFVEPDPLLFQRRLLVHEYGRVFVDQSIDETKQIVEVVTSGGPNQNLLSFRDTWSPTRLQGRRRARVLVS
jgi:hypothetical protein